MRREPPHTFTPHTPPAGSYLLQGARLPPTLGLVMESGTSLSALCATTHFLSTASRAARPSASTALTPACCACSGEG